MASVPSESERDDLISQFAGITGADSDRSQFFLELSRWNIDSAVNNFFETGQQSDDQAEGNIQVEGLPDESLLNRSFGGLSDFQRRFFDPEDDQEEEETPRKSHFLSPPSAEPSNTSSDRMSNRNPNDRPRIATLGSLKESSDQDRPHALENDDSDEDKPRQAFYAGGSERSGQQVLGSPAKKKDPNELVKDMFESAKRHGGQVVDENEGNSRRAPGFSGVGMRLGSEAEPSVEAVAGPSIPGLETVEPSNMVLKLWRNGFSVDDGPLREYTDSENADFLRSVKMGEIPRELITQARGGEVNLNMEDHREEEYVEVKRPVQAFAGEGHRLGNVAPTLSVSEIPVDDKATQKENEAAAQAALNVDDSRPVTNIQVRLADGSRLVLKINTNQSISSIRNFICRARPAMNAVPFKLLTTFPNKELDNEDQTIEEASLKGASVVQRLV